MITSQYLPSTVSLACTQITGDEPISLADAKLFLRVDTDDDNTLITSMISAARAAAEGKTHRVIRQSTWTWVVADLTGTIQVPITPCSACVSITVGGELIDPAMYSFQAGGLASPLFATITVPTDFPKGEATIVLTCGYADDSVPEDLVKWMYTRLGDFYEQRESYVAGSNFFEFSRNFVDALLDPYLIPDC